MAPSYAPPPVQVDARCREGARQRYTLYDALAVEEGAPTRLGGREQHSRVNHDGVTHCRAAFKARARTGVQRTCRRRTSLRQTWHSATRFPHVLCGIVQQGTFLTGLWYSAAKALSSQARGITPPAFSSRAHGIVLLGTFLVFPTWHSIYRFPHVEGGVGGENYPSQVAPGDARVKGALSPTAHFTPTLSLAPSSLTTLHGVSRPTLPP